MPRASTASPTTRPPSQWFRKAADRGVADSQYNLGILYARGIGVDQNLAESYKWFALAAAAGRPGRRQEARRCRRPARPAVARRGAARGADLHAGTAAGRGDERQGPARRMGPRALAPHRPSRRHRRKRAVLLTPDSRAARIMAGMRHPHSRLRPHRDRAIHRTFIRLTRIFVRAGRRIRRISVSSALVASTGARLSHRRILSRANLPSDRRTAGQCPADPLHGARGRLHLRHVRHRRRLPDDAAADLRRHRAGGRGRERREPRRRLVVLRRDLLLAPARARSGARHDAAGRRPDRHHRRRLAVHAAAPARPARSDDRAVLPDAARHRRHA